MRLQVTANGFGKDLVGDGAPRLNLKGVTFLFGDQMGRKPMAMTSWKAALKLVFMRVLCHWKRETGSQLLLKNFLCGSARSVFFTLVLREGRAQKLAQCWRNNLPAGGRHVGWLAIIRDRKMMEDAKRSLVILLFA